MMNDVRVFIGGQPLTFEEYQRVRYRPDLPPCTRCDSGTKCYCEVYGGHGPCACMGFTDCPDCPRGRPQMREDRLKGDGDSE